MRGWIIAAVGAAALGGLGFYALTIPKRIDISDYQGLSGDPAKGALVFAAAGCGACHAAPDATGEARLEMTGGMALPSPFGTFYAPNISSDPVHGIGGWSVGDLANAVLKGVSPEGAHYYPAFPYDSYQLMAPQDLVDLHSYLATLPASAAPNRAHDLPLPAQLRRGIGLWKLAFAREGYVIADDGLSPEALRGRYLVEGLGHCAECHTPRAVTGQLDRANWLSGTPERSGEGRIPDITPAGLDWSEGEIAEYLNSGFTPDYDSAGGHMALVVENYAKLPPEDRAAVAAYLKALPVHP